MADRTPIEWTDASWNPIRARATTTGKVGWFCTHVSEGCRNCYAEGFNARLGTQVDYKPQALKSGQVELFLDETMLTQPIRWRRPRRIFVGSMTDLFADFVTDAWLDCIFAVMALTPHHTYQLLTKRPERMQAYVSSDQTPGRVADLIMSMRQDHIPVGPLPHLEGGDTWWPLANVWLGVSVEDQATADARIPMLLDTPAAIRWLSAEPLLGEIALETAWHGENALEAECWGQCEWCDKGLPPLHNCQRNRQSTAAYFKGRSGLDWVVAGGESGHDARPMHPDWARQIRDDCEDADVAFLFKQWGCWTPVENVDRQSGTVQTADWFNDQWQFNTANLADGDGHIDDEPTVYRVGKKAAGRRLDGAIHDAYPAGGS